MRAVDYRAWLAGGASLVTLCMVAPATAQSAPPGEADEKNVIVVVGQTIEETLPQELAKYGSDVEIVTSEEIRESLFIDAQQAMQMKVPGLFVSPIS